MTHSFPKFDRKAFDTFRNDGDKRERAYNAPIYSVFEDDLPHEDKISTWVKFSFVEKLYSAGLRRHVLVQGDAHAEEVGAIDIVIKSLFEDGRIQAFRRLFVDGAELGDTLSGDNIEDVIDIHSRFVALLSGITRNSNACKSFCSKYLHFQFGVFPVYDRFAKIGLKMQIGRSGDKFDEYGDFTQAIYELLPLAWKGDAFSRSQIKSLDNYLVIKGRERKRSKTSRASA